MGRDPRGNVSHRGLPNDATPGRTSTVAGCLLVADGLDADAALADIDRRRSVTRKAHQPAPQTSAQIDVIRARAACR